MGKIVSSFTPFPKQWAALLSPLIPLSETLVRSECNVLPYTPVISLFLTESSAWSFVPSSDPFPSAGFLVEIPGENAIHQAPYHGL